uniref:Protein kinase domain-containing protein n=1 Tax=Globodera pallida TaxID=36090 RepID=A0A183CR05_GLOPA
MTDVEDTLHGQNDEIEPTNDKEFTADQQEEEQKKSDLPTDDTVKLADFGISRQQNAEGFAQTVYRARLYKSPECVLGQPYTPKTDISDSTEASDDLDCPDLYFNFDRKPGPPV